MKIALKFSILLALVSAVGSAPPAHAQGYPVKEITAVLIGLSAWLAQM